MKPQEILEEAPAKKPSTGKPNPRQTAQVQPQGVAWQFKLLMVVIAIGVLGLIGKVFGLF